MNKRELINICLELENVYEDYPFELLTDAPDDWALIRHKGNKKSFASVTIHRGRLMINLKCNPFEAGMLRQEFKDITAGYHMNKDHWNSVYPDGDVPTEMLRGLIKNSYELTKPKSKKSMKSGGAI